MQQELAYTPLEALTVARPVYRIPWLVKSVLNRKVLDLGAYDETALIKKNTTFWLHGQLCKTADEVIGIDSSEKIPAEGIRTSNSSWIFKGDIFDLSDLVEEHSSEIIVAGELIEHLPDTLSFLNNVQNEKRLAGMTLIVTTPNATAIHNALLAPFFRESNHPDHLQIYSYKTLNTLCLRAGFQSWEIIPYHTTFSEMILGQKPPFKYFTKMCEKILNGIEWLFPLLSGGWIVKIVI